MNAGLRNSVLAFVFLATALGAQNPPSLQITSPSSGTVVNPGQTLSVSVTSPSGTAFSQVFAIAEVPIGISSTATSVPAQLSLTIPSKIDCGVYFLTANGNTTAGQNIDSPSIAIDVERPDLPTTLTASPRGLILESLGQQTSVRLTATFADNSSLAVTQSTYLNYSSSKTSVATVDSSGKITAVGPGNAMVTETYTVGTNSVFVQIPVAIMNPALNVSPTSLSFASQPVGSSSTPQTVTLTNAATSNTAIQHITVKPSGADFSESDNCITSSPLTPTNGCTINVTFSPTAGGIRTATLSIPNSASAPIVISLSGTGTTTP